MLGSGIPISPPNITAMLMIVLTPSLKTRKARSSIPASRCLRSSRNVVTSRRTATRATLSVPDSPGSRRGAGSLTRRKSGIEKSTNHTATLRKEARTAASASGRKKRSGAAIITRLAARRTPPPRYPTAYPAVETRSTSSGRATAGSSAL
jgi:hypothetical protein